MPPANQPAAPWPVEPTGTQQRLAPAQGPIRQRRARPPGEHAAGDAAIPALSRRIFQGTRLVGAGPLLRGRWVGERQALRGRRGKERPHGPINRLGGIDQLQNAAGSRGRDADSRADRLIDRRLRLPFRVGFTGRLRLIGDGNRLRRGRLCFGLSAGRSRTLNLHGDRRDGDPRNIDRRDHHRRDAHRLHDRGARLCLSGRCRLSRQPNRHAADKQQRASCAKVDDRAVHARTCRQTVPRNRGGRSGCPRLSTRSDTRRNEPFYPPRQPSVLQVGKKVRGFWPNSSGPSRQFQARWPTATSFRSGRFYQFACGGGLES